MTSKYRKQIHAFLTQLDTLGGPDALREVMIEYVFNRIPPPQLQLVFDEISREYPGVKSLKLDQQEADPVREMIVPPPVPAKEPGKKMSVAEMLAAARGRPQGKPATPPKQTLSTQQILAACRHGSVVLTDKLPLAGVPTDLDVLDGAVREDLLKGGDDFILTPLDLDDDSFPDLASAQVIALEGDLGDDATATLMAGDVPGLGAMLDADGLSPLGLGDYLQPQSQPQSPGFLTWFGLGILFTVSVVATSVAILHFVFKLPI